MNIPPNQPTGPPRWATALLRWWGHPDALEEVEGDLLELYPHWVRTVGHRRASLRYAFSVLRLLRPLAKPKHLPNYPSDAYSTLIFFHPDMIRNYLLVSWRNLWKHKAFSLISVLGLALGMVCCLFILLWVQDEKGIDNFHANGPNIYTVYQTISTNGKVDGNYGTPTRVIDNRNSFLLEGMQQAVPGVRRVAFYATGYELPWGHPETFRVGEKKAKLSGSRASNDFLNILSYPLLAGDVRTALNDVRSIAISRKMATLFFGNPHQAVGKTIRYENKLIQDESKLDFIVTAVFEDLPVQSSLQFDFLFSWEAQKSLLEWASGNVRTFVELADGANPAAVESRINRFLRPRLAHANGVDTRVGLQLVGDQYLHNLFVNGKPTGGRIDYVRLFSGVALFILLIACINFMNLATARSVKRAKEVGVRKVLGSTRGHLIGQFFGEAALLSGLAMIATVLLVVTLMPMVNTFVGKQMPSPIYTGAFWGGLLMLLTLTSLVAGSYPALFLSSLQPVRVLKGLLQFTQRAVWFRQGLTVFQFSLAILLVVVAIVVSKQTGYVQNRHLGYDRENLLYVRIEGELMNYRTYQHFKEQASRMPGVALVDRSSEAPHAMGFVVDGTKNTTTGEDAIKWEGKDKNASVSFKPTSVGFDFVKLMKLRLAQGRDFSRAIATDSADAFLVNEEAVRQMGLKQPLGKWVSAWEKRGHIVGVLNNYHTHSLHEPIKPLIMDVKEYEYFGVILVRMQAGKTKEALASLEAVYRSVNPNYPFDYQFVNQEYAKLYQSEQLMTKIADVFAGLAILISCLGLLGLAMFAAEQRTREIALRKVLGASVASIVTLLSQNFIKLVGIAILLALPLAWFAMNRWLQSFAYRTEMPWWIFVISGAGALGLTLLTVSFQSIKAALTNPVKSLRGE